MNSFAYTSKHGICCLLLFLSLLTMMPFQALSQSPDTSDPYNNYKVSPSMAIIVVVLISALFFMVFFSLYIRRCSNSSSSTINIPGTTIAGRSRTAARGLDATLINTFPTFVYSDVKGHKIGKGGLECAVCLSEFEDNETLRLIPNCDHVFHVDCIDVWLSSHTTCPVCRANLSTQPGDPVTEPELTDSNVESQEEIVEEVGDSNADVVGEEVEVSNEGQGRTLRRSRTRGSGSWRPRKFPRSHTTGHSLVHPDENTDRFTLKLPAKVRTEIVNKALDRAASMRVLDREESSKRASNQIDDKEKNLNGKKLDPLDQGAKSDRWALSRNRSLLVRASSFLTRVSSMVRSPRVAAEDGEGTSSQPVRTNSTERRRPPV